MSPGFALVVGNRLVLGDGTVVDVSVPGQVFVESAYATRAGWVVSTFDVRASRYTVWLVNRDVCVARLDPADTPPA